MKDEFNWFKYNEVTKLLEEMEACVNRVKVLCAKITIGYGEG